MIWSCEMAPKENEFELKAMKTKEVVLQNFEFISSGDMDSFQNTISDDFKFILSGTLKWNDGRPLSRTYERVILLSMNLTPALATMPNGLISISIKS